MLSTLVVRLDQVDSMMNDFSMALQAPVESSMLHYKWFPLIQETVSAGLDNFAHG